MELVQGLTFSSTPAGTTMDLKEREWGQMGVMSIHGTLGWTMLAPAASEYAVLPVGVAMMIPTERRRIMAERCASILRQLTKEIRITGLHPSESYRTI